MMPTPSQSSQFDIVIVAQNGRLTYEAVLFAASLRRFAPGFDGGLIIAEPQSGPLWNKDPSIQDEAARELLVGRLGAKIQPFESKHFGTVYPNGNKVEALASLPKDRPFVFFDTDTLITGQIDQIAFPFDYPSASMARENTWPKPQLYGPGFGGIWQSLYSRYDIPFEATLDFNQPDEHWERYLYFNAGWFFFKCAPTFANRMIHIMTDIRDNTPPELAAQALTPWLDQIALPLVIAEFGGGRPGPELSGLDGAITHHWRTLPLYYATASDDQIARFEELTAPNWLKKVLKAYEPFRRTIYQGRGRKARALFDQANLPRNQQAIRNRLKRENLWMR